MAMMLLIGAGPLVALLAADREISARAAGTSSRTRLTPNPSSTAMGEGAYVDRNAASLHVSAPGSRVSHSQTTSTDQPFARKAFSAARSRV